MITPEYIKNYLKQDFINVVLEDDIDGIDGQLIQSAINNAYDELSVLDGLISDKVMNLYAKTISTCNLLDRLGVENTAFSGLYKQADEIRQFIGKVMQEKIKAKSYKIKGGIVEKDTHITDNFINRYEDIIV